MANYGYGPVQARDINDDPILRQRIAEGAAGKRLQADAEAAATASRRAAVQRDVYGVAPAADISLDALPGTRLATAAAAPAVPVPTSLLDAHANGPHTNDPLEESDTSRLARAAEITSAGDARARLGVQSRAARPSEPTYPGLSSFTNPAPSAPNNYDRPFGGPSSQIKIDPLQSLGAAQIAQDEDVRAERDARYGRHFEEIDRAEARNDPMRKNLAAAAANAQYEDLLPDQRPLYGAEGAFTRGEDGSFSNNAPAMRLGPERRRLALAAGQANLQSDERERLRQTYIGQADHYQGLASEKIAGILKSSAPQLEKDTQIATVKERLAIMLQNIREAYGISEHINSPGLLGKDNIAGVQ